MEKQSLGRDASDEENTHNAPHLRYFLSDFIPCHIYLRMNGVFIHTSELQPANRKKV